MSVPTIVTCFRAFVKSRSKKLNITMQQAFQKRSKTDRKSKRKNLTTQPKRVTMIA